MEKLISIIVPVYNVENYIERCLDSILNQNCSQELFEIVLIDDGSTDRSGSICDRYNDKYGIIRVFHKENGGLSDARNCGIELASGKYLLFLDSDDQLNREALPKIIDSINSEIDADLYIGRYIILDRGEKAECQYNFCNMPEGYCGEALLYTLLNLNSNYNWYAWLNIVKKSFLIDKKLFFEKGRYFEDVLWTPQLIYYAGKVNFFSYPFYIYTQNRKGAITRNFSGQVFRDKLYVCNFVEDICSKWNLEIATQKKLWGTIHLIYNSILAGYWLFNTNERKILFKEIIRYRHVLKCSNRIRDKFLYFISFIIGLRGVSFLLFLRFKFLLNNS